MLSGFMLMYDDNSFWFDYNAFYFNSFEVKEVLLFKFF